MALVEVCRDHLLIDSPEVAGLVKVICQGGEEPCMGCAVPPRLDVVQKGLFRSQDVSASLGR